MPICPRCSSTKIVKNGHIHNGKQRLRCNECHRQFVENPQKIMISQQKRELIDRLLLERISLAGQLPKEASVARARRDLGAYALRWEHI